MHGFELCTELPNKWYCSLLLLLTLPQGCLGGSVGSMSNFSSGHVLTVHEFEPRIEAELKAKPASDLLSPSLPLLHSRSLSLSLKNKYTLKKKESSPFLR